MAVVEQELHNHERGYIQRDMHASQQALRCSIDRAEIAAAGGCPLPARACDFM
jgi:hypothetical protein